MLDEYFDTFIFFFLQTPPEILDLEKKMEKVGQNFLLNNYNWESCYIGETDDVRYSMSLETD